MASFQYCLNSSTIRPTPILQKIQVAAEAGYAGIELWHDDIDLYVESGGKVEDVRKCLDDHGLVAPTTIFLKGWWDTDGSDYTTAIDEIKRRLAQSAIVGAAHAIAGPPLTMCDHRLGGQRYAALLEVGREFGVRPAAEYLGFADDINTIEDALEIMDGSGDADATIVLDPFHCFRGGGPIESIDKLTADRIAISHFNDSPSDPPRESQHDRDRVMPGDGIVDLKLYCDKLRQIGYDRWMSLELFHPGYWEQDPLETAKIGLEKMQAAAEA